MALALFTLVYLHALWRGLSGIGELDFNSLASYYSPLNALRIGKGLFLGPGALSRVDRRTAGEDRARSNRLLTTGLLLGMSGVAAVVLRERGVLHDMVYYQGLRQLLDSLLDFGTSYRITALFADMHTGGEAIDGLQPGVAFRRPDPRHSPNPVACCIRGRGDSCGVLRDGRHILAWRLFQLRSCGFHGLHAWCDETLEECPREALPADRPVQRRVGNRGHTGVPRRRHCCHIGVHSRFRNRGRIRFGSERGLASSLLRGLATSSALGCAAIAAYAAITSKWAHMAPGTGISLAVSAAVLFALAGAHLNHGWRGQLGTRNRALASLLLCAAIAAFVPSLFGSRMEQRFATTTQGSAAPRRALARCCRGDGRRLEHADPRPGCRTVLRTLLLGQATGQGRRRFRVSAGRRKRVPAICRRA